MTNETAFDRIVRELDNQGRTVRNANRFQVQASCPVPGHGKGNGDRNPSLSVTDNMGQALVYCHAGCAPEDIMDALGMTMADMYDDHHGNTYVYPDGRNVHRIASGPTGKDFRQSGTKKGNALYNSDKITAATPLVFVCEGEKDCDAVVVAGGGGCMAVCSAMGAGKAHLADWSRLLGKHVVIVADKDEPGKQHALQVVSLLEDVKPASVRVVEAKIGKDAADHIAAGHGINDFVDATWWTLSDASKARAEQQRPRLWNARELKKAAQPTFLAKNRIPKSAITILIGEEGIGKSLLWVLVAAAITTGKPMPELGIPPRDPANVILILTEDEWDQVVLPRLEVAGANLDHVHVICTEDDGSGSPTFPDDMHLIINAVPAPAMVVCDAWLDTVPPNLQVRDAQQSRLALHPWKEAASSTGAAMMLLAHSNRVETANIRDKYGATAALRQKARMTLYCLPDETGKVLIVGPDKSNGASARTKASMFRIQPVQYFDPTPDHDGTIPLLVFERESSMTIKEHLAEVAERERTKGKAPAAAELWLRDFLKDGMKLATVVYSEAETLGFSKDQVKRAKANINKGRDTEVKTFRVTSDGPWYWELQLTRDDDDDAKTPHAEANPGSEVGPISPYPLPGAPLQVREGVSQSASAPWQSEVQGAEHSEAPNGSDLQGSTRERREGNGEPDRSLDRSLDPGDNAQAAPDNPKMTGQQTHSADNGSNDAYVKGMCRDCHTRPQSAGGPRCEQCHKTWQAIASGYDR